MTGSITDTARTLVRRRTEAQMNSTVSIVRGGAGTLDPGTLVVSGLTGAQTVYPQGAEDGRARIHTVTGEGSISVGVGQIDVRQVIVSIPAVTTATPQRDDLITVLTCPADPDMVGRVLRVVEVAGGSLFGDARRLSCTMWNPSSQWSGQ